MYFVNNFFLLWKLILQTTMWKCYLSFNLSHSMRYMVNFHCSLYFFFYLLQINFKTACLPFAQFWCAKVGFSWFKKHLSTTLLGQDKHRCFRAANCHKPSTKVFILTDHHFIKCIQWEAPGCMEFSPQGSYILSLNWMNNESVGSVMCFCTLEDRFQ